MMFLKNSTTLTCYGISLLVYALILLWGLLGDIRGSMLGYGMLCFYVIIPILSLVTAIVLNANNADLKWMYPFIFSAFGIAIPAILALNKLTTWAMFSDVWLFCIIPPFLGSTIGFFIRFRASRG
jgi:hypothetical protein